MLFAYNDNNIKMVMEFCFCSLADILKYCPEIPMSETHIAAVCAAVAKGLAYLHAFGTSHSTYLFIYLFHLII